MEEKRREKEVGSKKKGWGFSLLTSHSSLNNQAGQVAVILILVTAVALIFYAVSLNFNRLSQVKTMATIASDTSAAQMASGMASYGQAQSEGSLKGGRKVCGYTGVFAAIIGFILAIIILIVTIVSWGTATAPMLAVYAAIMATIVLAVQLAVIQPGISDMWSRITSKMGPRDQLIEGAIQSGLQKIVTDNKKVPDLYDFDGDRVWETDPVAPAPQDTIGRFSLYYTERLKQIGGGALADIGSFVDALQNFLYVGADSWGLYDPYASAGQQCFTAECDYCCVPASVTLYGETITRAEDCDPSFDWAGSCTARSPYGMAYPWVYNPHFEDPANGVFSFREQIGRDDEHQLYEKVAASPNGPQNQMLPPPPYLPLSLVPPPVPLPPSSSFYYYSYYYPWNFTLKDTTTYYPADTRKGVFPFFYKAADWTTDLARRNPAINPADCYWSDYTDNPGIPALGDDIDFACPAGPIPSELDAQRLDLPVALSALTYNRNPWVDDVNDNVAGNPPLAPDKVTFPDYIVENDLSNLDGDPDTLEPDPKCAQRALFDTTNMTGFWKRGGDRFCAVDGGDADAFADWPYWALCPKHNPGTCFEDGLATDCQCGDPGTNPANFPDDVLDDLVYGLPDFIDWAKEIIARGSSDIDGLAADFTNWYPQAAAWIEPGTAASPTGSSAVAGSTPAMLPLPPPPPSPLECFRETCRAEDGYLHTWRKEIDMMNSRLEGWKTANYQAAPGNACSEVWCVPNSVGACDIGPPYVSAREAATFDSNGNGIQGDLEDITACLDWNANDTVIYPLPGLAEFVACRDACVPCNPMGCLGNGVSVYDACATLPPSPYPVVNGFFLGDVATIYACLIDCKNGVCQTMNPIYFSSNPATYDFESPTSTCRAGGPGTWYFEMNWYLTSACWSTSSFWQQLNLTIDSPGPTVTGNAEKFQACYDACVDCVNNDNCADVDSRCSDLPRSLVPGFYPNEVYGAPNGALVSDLNSCRNDCTTCDNGCAATRDTCITVCAGNGACIGGCNATYATCSDACSCTAPLTGVLDCSSTNFTILINTAKGACSNPFFMGDGLPAAPNGLLESIPEAKNQVAKFNQRLKFLQNRLREVNKMTGLSMDAGDDNLLYTCLENCNNVNCQINLPAKYFQAPLNPTGPGDPSKVDFEATQCGSWMQGNVWYDAVADALGAFTIASRKFAAFLDGPAAALIQTRIAYTEAVETGLPYEAIYGWMSDPPPGDTLGRGRWHIVKVEARLPGKCDRACNVNQTATGDPSWPWIRTYTKDWGTRRCYELTSTEGVVKFRTIRFDENRGSSVLFPNGVPLWEFKYFHPERPVDYAGAGDTYAQTLDTLGNVTWCGPSMIQILPDARPAPASYGDAFMLNKRDDNTRCWDAVHKLLTRGVVSERCAQYYWHEGANRGMGFKFIPCQAF